MLMSMANRLKQNVSTARAGCVRWLVVLMLVEMFPLGITTMAKSGNCNAEGCNLKADMRSIAVNSACVAALSVIFITFQLLEVLAMLGRRNLLAFAFIFLNALKTILLWAGLIAAIVYFFAADDKHQFHSAFLYYLGIVLLHTLLLLQQFFYCRAIFRKPTLHVVG